MPDSEPASTRRPSRRTVAPWKDEAVRVMVRTGLRVVVESSWSLGPVVMAMYDCDCASEDNEDDEGKIEGEFEEM